MAEHRASEEEIIAQFATLKISSPEATQRLTDVLGDSKLAARKVHLIRLIQRLGPDEAFRIIGIATEAGFCRKEIWERKV